MGTLYGVLIDTVSIQKYVFASSKLKENIGASYIVSDVLKKMIISLSEKYETEKGYCGGGNYLLFFKNDKDGEAFIKELTCLALHQAPGLRIITACEKYEFDGNYEDDVKYSVFKERLFKKLSENKRKILPKVTLDSHGINEDCPRTGLTAEIWHKEGDDFMNYVSSVSKAKYSYCIEAEKKWNDIAKEIFGEGFNFPAEFDKLGHSKHEDSHIAVVHIDGNAFGEKFEKIKTLKETRELSEKLEAAIKDSFDELLKHIKEKLPIINEYIDSTDSKVIPIRPIIMGGDDITFICDGRLGIYFAEKFIAFFNAQEIAKTNKLSMCAGIAVVKLKFPFYRAYLLAEDLCSNAKTKRHINGQKGSWIDYHISYSSFSDNINGIREKEFICGGKTLTMKPYSLDTDKPVFSEIVRVAKIFTDVKADKTSEREPKGNGKPLFPRNKLKLLREFIVEGGERTDFEHQFPDIDIPDIGNLQNDFFAGGGKTPYLDAIELTELYPFKLIIENGKESK